MTNRGLKGRIRHEEPDGNVEGDDMKKNILIFLSGCLFGAVILISIGFYNIQKDKGKPLIGAKVHGNIRILRPKLPDEDWFYDESIILIQKDDENIIAMFFDKDDKLSSVNYHHNKEIVFDASGLNKTRQLYSYGGNYGYNYYDFNCDGILDSYDLGSDRNIFIEGKWLKVNRKNGLENIIVDDGVERVFVFDYENGWVENVE